MESKVINNILVGVCGRAPARGLVSLVFVVRKLKDELTETT